MTSLHPLSQKTVSGRSPQESDRGSALVVLAAGGTGGHVFPAEALAAELGQRGYRLALITDRRGGALSGRLGEIDVHRIRAGGIAGKSAVNRITSVAELGIGTLQAWRLVRRLHPAVVVGFGGYASLPTMVAASFTGVATAIHEQNAVLGRANRLLAPRVKRIATSFETVKAIPDSAASKVVRTGMPVRPAILEARNVPYPAIAANGPIELLVTGGSQGARVFSHVVPAAIGQLDDELRTRLRVTQQCRAEDLESVRRAYDSLGVDATLKSFFDDVPARIAAAHLVICRSGASTVSELTAVGRPAILVPYPHAVDDHQTYNAHAIDRVGGGWLMPEPSFTPEALAERLQSLFSMPRLLEQAAAAARAAGIPDAAANLAEAVISLMADNDNRRVAA